MKKIFFSLILALPFCVQGQDIVHIAGNYTCGYGGDGGRAYYASLSAPMSICSDATGNLYIGDHFFPSALESGYVRRVDAATGIISTIAGGATVVATDTLDNIPATDAFISEVSGLCIDNNGDLLIADGQSRVRKVNLSTGGITTVAGHYQTTLSSLGDGGPATNASLDEPLDVAVDSANNIYVSCNISIRKITAATGIISTIAGGAITGGLGDGGPATAATLNSAFGICVDKTGNIYVADDIDCRVRMIGAATGIITTIAGTGTAGFSGDGGPATAAGIGPPLRVAKDNAGNVYISTDTYSSSLLNNCRIRKIDAVTGNIATYAGGDTILPANLDTVDDNGPATASYLNPWGICIDSCGDLFVADRLGCSVRAITAPGMGLPGGGVLCRYNILGVASPPALSPVGRLTIYPNPAMDGTFSLNVSSAVNEDVRVVITNMMGEVVDEFSAVTNKKIDMRVNVAVGVYFVSAVTAEGRWEGKVLVQ